MPRPVHGPAARIAAFPAIVPYILLGLLTAAVPADSAASAASAASASTAASAASATAGEPRVFRGYLEGEASPMIFLALGERMTLAYDERGGSLFMAWKGKAVPASGPAPASGEAGAVGAPAKGADADGIRRLPPSTAAYKASGPVFHRRIRPRPWAVGGAEGILPVTVRFEGISAHGDLASLEWTLRLKDGRTLRVTETPMFDDHYGDDGLFRNFTVKGIPAGHSVRLDLNGRGMAETWGGGGDGGMIEEGGRRLMVQEADGQTPLKVTWSKRAY